MNLDNTILNDVLCFLTTSRDSLTSDDACIIAVAFYKPDDIVQAKETLFTICKEKLIRRKACQQHPNPNIADIQDILNLLTKKDDGRSILPKFVAESYQSLPPAAGFISFARAFNRLRDEMS